MSKMEIDSLWQSAFGDTATRPKLYNYEETSEEGWHPLTDSQQFIMNWKTLNPQQLYAASANNQRAMKAAQDEYLELERQVNMIRGKDTFKNPQTFLEPIVYEERKESTLYGYKYEANRPALLHAGHPGIRTADELTEREKQDVRLFQEPFEQGGFVPKEREYRAKVAKAKDPKNVDGWEPIIDNQGRRLIPRQQVHQDEYTMTYVKRNVDANGELVRPVSSAGSEAAGEAVDKAPNKRLTRTRFDGKKVPATRDASEAPSAASTPRGRKRASPSGADQREATSSAKRQKVDTTANSQEQPKPKHPNQYTKARERAAREKELASKSTDAAETSGKATVAPTRSNSRASWRELSPTSKYNHSWTAADLHQAVREDHSWLSSDPVKAEQWKNKLLDNENPIRSFAMFKKWHYWRENNQDKRPRNKNAGNEDAQPTKKDETPPTVQRSNRNATTSKMAGDVIKAPTPVPTPPPSTMTPAQSTTPAPEPANGDEETGKASTPAAKPPASKASKGKERGKRHSTTNGHSQASPSKSPSAAADDEQTQGGSKEVHGNNRRAKRPNLDHRDSDSTIVVNGGAAQSHNPSNGGPPRRSLRVMRRLSN